MLHPTSLATNIRNSETRYKTAKRTRKTQQWHTCTAENAEHERLLNTAKW